MNLFNTGLIFTPDLFILCKNVWGLRKSRGGTANFDIPNKYTKLHVIFTEAHWGHSFPTDL